MAHCTVLGCCDISWYTISLCLALHGQLCAAQQSLRRFHQQSLRALCRARCHAYRWDWNQTACCVLTPIPLFAAQVNIVRLLVGTFMTSLDMAGVSITLWPVNHKQLERLDAPSQVW